MQQRWNLADIDPAELFIGKRLKAARVAKQLSQLGLARLVGLTGQQIQKYEWGVNRVSAARLSQLAEILGVSLLFFFPEENEVLNGEKENVETLVSSMDPSEIEFVRQLRRIGDDELKRNLLKLLGALPARVGQVGQSPKL